SVGGAGVPLWSAKDGKLLVPPQPSRCGGLRAVFEAGDGTTKFVSCGQLSDCAGSARPGVNAGRVALRGGASDVCPPAYRARRPGRAGSLVWSALHTARSIESLVGEPHRLVLVHGITSGIWHRRRFRRGAADANTDAGKSVSGLTRRN